MQSADDQFKNLRDEFNRLAKNIYIYKTENRALPARDKIERDTTSLFNTYDNLVTLLTLIFPSQGEENKQFLIKIVNHFFKPKLLETLIVYGLTIQLPNNFGLLDRNTVKECTESELLQQHPELNKPAKQTKKGTLSNASSQSTHIDVQPSTSTGFQTNDNSVDENFESAESEQSSTSSTNTVVDRTISTEIQNTSETSDPINTQQQQQVALSNSSQHSSSTESVNMVQTTGEFISLAGRIMNYRYDGDPTQLNSFLNDIELVEGLVEPNNANVTAYCVRYIFGKLIGKASECMPEQVTTLQTIKDSLKAGIKEENSKVVVGKMAALRVMKGDFSTYHKEAEKLAEQLRRSYISEGLTKIKANEESIDKTKEMCRRAARTDVVKSVISSSHYQTPAEVIATFITQNDLARKEHREREAFKNGKQQNRQNKNAPRQFQNDRRQNYNKNGQFDRNSNGNRNDRSYNRGNRRSDNSRGKPNKNEHTIRFIANQPNNTPKEQETNSNGEAFFRIVNP